MKTITNKTKEIVENHWTWKDDICHNCPAIRPTCWSSRNPGYIYNKIRKEHELCMRWGGVKMLRSRTKSMNYKHSELLPPIELLSMEYIFDRIENDEDCEIRLNRKEGQEKLTLERLKDLIAVPRDKSIHVYGPVGSGKTALAIALSNEVNCYAGNKQFFSSESFFKMIIDESILRSPKLLRKKYRVIVIDELFQEPKKIHIINEDTGWVITPVDAYWGLKLESFFSERYEYFGNECGWLITTSLMSIKEAWKRPDIRERYTASTFDRLTENMIEICLYRSKSHRK